MDRPPGSREAGLDADSRRAWFLRAVTGPQRKYALAADVVRNQVADGTLKPGQPAPSGANLARLTGFSIPTCRRALRELTGQGVLTPGPSPNARPRVAVPGGTPAGDAAGDLSRALAARRRAAGLTQPQLAALADCSVTTVGHAETGRLWQARAFWENADSVLTANGALTALHDAYRAETNAPAAADRAQPLASPPTATVVTRVTLHWSDGTSSEYPPGDRFEASYG